MAARLLLSTDTGDQQSLPLFEDVQNSPRERQKHALRDGARLGDYAVLVVQHSHRPKKSRHHIKGRPHCADCLPPSQPGVMPAPRQKSSSRHDRPQPGMTATGSSSTGIEIPEFTSPRQKIGLLVCILAFETAQVTCLKFRGAEMSQVALELG